MREKLLKNMGYLIVLLDIGIYFILSYVFVKEFQKNILATIINSVLLFIGAIIATTALMKQGILSGRENARYKETLLAHIAQKQAIYPKIKFLQTWLDEDYYRLMENGRAVYVNSAGYDYNEVFTRRGKIKDMSVIEKPKSIKDNKWYLCIGKTVFWMFSEEWKLYRQKKSFIKKAKRYKITRQTVSYLLNIDEDSDPNNFGITENQYVKARSGMAVISRLLFSILLQSISFGFYGFKIETFLIQMLSVILILISALFSMFNAYFFMVKTHRETIIKKINKLEEFDNASLAEIVEKSVKEERENGEIHTEISMPAESNMVEKIR